MESENLSSLIRLYVSDSQKTDPEVASLIPVRSNTFVEIDHEIISMTILLPSADSRKAVVR